MLLGLDRRNGDVDLDLTLVDIVLEGRLEDVEENQVVDFPVSHHFEGLLSEVEGVDADLVLALQDVLLEGVEHLKQFYPLQVPIL